MESNPMNKPVHKIGRTFLLGLYRQYTRSTETPGNVRLCTFLNRLIDQSKLLLDIDQLNDPTPPVHVQTMLGVAAEQVVYDDPTWIPSETLAADNKHLRRLLALQVAGSSLYMDDGELSDASVHPVIDFKRMSVSDIEAALRRRGMNRLKAATAITGEGVPDASVAS